MGWLKEALLKEQRQDLSRLVLGAIKDHDPLGKGPGLMTVF